MTPTGRWVLWGIFFAGSTTFQIAVLAAAILLENRGVVLLTSVWLLVVAPRILRQGDEIARTGGW